MDQGNSGTELWVGESSESQEAGDSVLPQFRVTNKEDLLTNLPREITDEILRKLPIRSIMRCKCVQKSWRDLIKGVEFAASYNPKPCLIFPDKDSASYAMCDETWQPLFLFGLPPPRDHYSPDPLKRLVIGW
ncbi:putative F-box protein At1g50880 [Salvia splendens]|uniref:putative F-box protein At1g50880 n=1 Tax=Salvia splendens TaxID=180675 RepID=UPI001C25C65A|nr:putative F-box protein At1g50880 [Salvia splendens]